jgi:hypothetical protein
MPVRSLTVLGVVNILLVGIFSGCIYMGGSPSTITGSGPVKTESRTVAEFTTIEARGGINLELSIGAPTSVQVTAQENLLPIVTTSVANGKLTAATTQNYVSSSMVTVTVVVSSLSELAVSEGIHVGGSGIAAGALSLRAEEGAAVTLTGTVDTFTLTASEGTLLDLGGFVARDAAVTLSDGVTGTIAATGNVTGTASNGVVISVAGNPASLNITTSSGAIVTRQ